MAGQIDQAATCNDGLQFRGMLRHARVIRAPSPVGQHFIEVFGKVKALVADTRKRSKRRAG